MNTFLPLVLRLHRGELVNITTCIQFLLPYCTHIWPQKSYSFQDFRKLFSSVHSVMSDSFQPHEPACQDSLSITNSRVHPNSCPLSQWCHPTISSSVIPFSSCPQSFPASGSFPMSQFFTSGGQSIGVSASTSVLPMNTQDWSPLGWTGWISLQSKDSQESSP